MSSTLSEQVAEMEAERAELKERVSLLEALPRVPVKDSRVPRVITAEELKPGQVISVFENGAGWTVGTVTDELFLKLNHSRALMDIEQETDGTIVLLADAPEPAEAELPTEPGSVILVTEWEGRKLNKPIQAMLDASGVWGGAEKFPDVAYAAYPEEITGWKKARIVVEDGES